MQGATGRSKKKAGAADASAAVPATQSSRTDVPGLGGTPLLPTCARRRCRKLASRCRGRSAALHAISWRIASLSCACSPEDVSGPK